MGLKEFSENVKASEYEVVAMPSETWWQEQSARLQEEENNKDSIEDARIHNNNIDRKAINEFEAAVERYRNQPNVPLPPRYYGGTHARDIPADTKVIDSISYFVATL